MRFMLEGIKKLFTGDENAKKLKQFAPLVEKINGLEESISSLSDVDLKAKTTEFKERIEKGESLDDLLPEAFAVVREASKRTLGQRHYDVQLIGGAILHNNSIAEMRTGEGKTLVATLPTYLNALTGKGVHVVTVNDYLSRRDAVWMGQIHAFLGLTVSVINHSESYIYDVNHKEDDEERDAEGGFRVHHEFLRPCTRTEAYEADITYGTNSEFGFDYLRDNIEYKKDGLRQRKHHFAIVDEIDSILIDEARTPLIISAPTADSESLYQTFSQIVRGFVKDEDYTVEEKHRTIAVTDAGIEKAEKALGVDNIYTDKGIKYVHHLETAVRAKALFNKDKEYVVREDQVVIVDEFTGRMQPGRRWSEGLHQAIEAKEGVKLQQESRTFASITYQNYFRQYEKLAGMTGTAKTSSEEFFKVYQLDVVEVPTNREVQRIDSNDLIFQTEKGKFKAIARTVKELQEKGQPVLIGTASVEKNELLSAYLKEVGVKHEVLNAKNHEQEGEIIAQAGVKGRVTIATNMAGRGVDIKLGGNPGSDDLYKEVKALGGLAVIGTERHEARRIDNQLRGRAGRQGDPGFTQFYVSFEDQLMRVFASDMIQSVMGRLGVPEDQHIENKMITRSLETAQTKIEGFHFDARKHVLQYDDVMTHQRETIYGKRRAMLTGTNEEVDAVIESLTDGDEAFAKVIEEKRELLKENFYDVFRRVYLQSIDMLWVEHLEVMDYMRSSVNLRAYGQRDPLVEYKKEGLALFRELEGALEEQVKSVMPNINAEGVAEREKVEFREVHKGAQQLTQAAAARVIRDHGTQKKIGRNEVVTIEKDGETQEMKFKKAEPLIKNEGWKLKE